MSVRPTHRRLVGAVIAGLALTLVPAVAMSSASAAPEAPASPVSLRVDNTVPQGPGRSTVRWDAPAGEVDSYRVSYVRETDGTPQFGEFQDELSFAVPAVDPGESIEVSVTAYRDEVPSEPATLRLTTLDDVAPDWGFGDAINNTFAYEISWLATSGITTGYVVAGAYRVFAPSAPVLREQVAAFLYRFAAPYQQQSFEPPTESPFADVPTTHPFYREITWARSYGLTTGYQEANGTTTFRPSQPVLREQMAAFLYRFDFSEYETDEQSFADVPTGATFHDEIEWLASEGIATGYDQAGTSSTFRGTQPVLREQTAAFLYRYRTNTFVNPNTVG